MKTFRLLTLALPCLALALRLQAGQPSSQITAPHENRPIPFSAPGAKATADYERDATGIQARAEGARLHTPATPPGKTQQLTFPDQTPEGLARSDWQSIRAAHEAGRHAFIPVEGGWQARNPGHQWTTRFDGRGFIAQPRGAEWQWGLELKS